MSLDASNVVDIIADELEMFGEDIFFTNYYNKQSYDYEKICEVLKRYKLVKR